MIAGGGKLTSKLLQLGVVAIHLEKGSGEGEYVLGGGEGRGCGREETVADAGLAQFLIICNPGTRNVHAQVVSQTRPHSMLLLL